jgi:hypothetical protein
MVRGWIIPLVHRHQAKDCGEDFNLVVVVAVVAAVEAVADVSHEKIRNVAK